MPVYTWEGRTRQGTTKKGVMEAVGEAAVMAQLRAQMITPLSVRAKSKDLLEGIKFFKSGPKTRDLVIFTRQFATMIDAGLPLVQCLSIQADQQPKAGFKAVILGVKADVEQGSTFADALGKHPGVFNDLYVNLVRAGEVGGILDTILTRLAQYMEKADALKRKVKSAMVYPATIVVVAIGVITLLLVKVIPVFKKMFEEMGGALPAPTQMVVDLSAFMQQWVLVILGGMVAVVVGFFSARKRIREFRYRTDAFFLRVPVFGPLLRKVAVARFSRTLGKIGRA